VTATVSAEATASVAVTVWVEASREQSWLAPENQWARGIRTVQETLVWVTGSEWAACFPEMAYQSASRQATGWVRALRPAWG